MVKDDHNTDRPADANRATECPPARRITMRTVIASALVAAVLTVGGVFLVQWLAHKPEANGQEKKGPMLFQGWDKPDFVLMLSGQQHGYILPCGCSDPQYGGLERRYNLFESLKGRDWPVVAVDLGDIPQKAGPRDLPNVQGMLKYLYSMRALNKMNYIGIGVGEFEAALHLERAVSSYGSPAQQAPIVVSNLDRTKNIVLREETVPWHVAEVPGTNFKVAVVSIVGPDVDAQIEKILRDESVRFEGTTATLDGDSKNPGVLKAIQAKKPNLQVLLYQGPLDKAKACAAKFPNFNVVLCLSETDEPPAQPAFVNHNNNTKTMVVTVGHKGKNVGVVGCFARNGKPADGFDLQYQMVRLDQAFLTPKEKRKEHPVVQLMEEYTQLLKKDNFMSKYPQHAHQLQAGGGLAMPTFVGSDACAKCHENMDDSVKIWKASGHSHAYATLEKAEMPSLRQFDAECVVCHVVGFGYKEGFKGLEGITDEKELKRQKSLLNVGCESCHGPCSEHVRNPDNKEWRAKINPFKFNAEQAALSKKNPKDAKDDKAAQAIKNAQVSEQKRIRGLDQFCQKCHDLDNDVNWDLDKKWKKVEHRSPPPAP